MLNRPWSKQQDQWGIQNIKSAYEMSVL